VRINPEEIMRVATLVQFVAMLIPVAAQTQMSASASSSSSATSPTQDTTMSAQRASPCASGAHREFDFWAGNWVVKDGSGEEVGRNSIEIEQRGCVLIERWTGAEGGTGMSLNFYDPVARVWTQQWVSPGAVLTMTGRLVNGAMVLEGPLHYLKDGRATRLKGTWTLLPDGRVRQHFVESADQGKTWTEWFDGYYSPI
jgi:hypothetical protein